MSKKAAFSIDKYLVLRCRGFYSEETLPTLVGAIVAGPIQVQSGRWFSMGTPCITTNDFKTEYPNNEHDEALEGFSANKIIVINSFKYGVHPWIRMDVSSRSLKPEFRIKSPVEVMKVIEDTALDVDKAARLRDYINDIGCVSFILSEKDKRAKQTIEFLKAFSKPFRHLFETFSHMPRPEEEVISSLEKDELLSILSFYNVKSVAPILDTRRVDGILIMLESVLRSSVERKKTIEPLDTICLLYTNYLENFIHLDGCRLNDFKSFDDRTIERLSKVLRKKSMSKMQGPKKSKEEMSVKALKKEDMVTYEPGTIRGDLNMSNSDSSIWITTSSSSTAYYNR